MTALQPNPTVDANVGTGVYVYGIVREDAHDVARDTLGIGGQALRLVSFEGVSAVISRVPPGDEPKASELVKTHARVLEELNAASTVIPVRVGQVMIDDEAVAHEVLRSNTGHLHDLLDALEGRDQFVVRAMYNEPEILAEIVQGNPEIARLRSRTRELPADVGQSDRFRLGELVAYELDMKRRTDGATVMEAAEPYVAAHVLRESTDMHRLLEVAFLVDGDCRHGFEDALEDVAEAMAERARLQLFGPMPPYDFVGD